MIDFEAMAANKIGDWLGYQKYGYLQPLLSAALQSVANEAAAEAEARAVAAEAKLSRLAEEFEWWNDRAAIVLLLAANEMQENGDNDG